MNALSEKWQRIFSFWAADGVAAFSVAPDEPGRGQPHVFGLFGQPQRRLGEILFSILNFFLPLTRFSHQSELKEISNTHEFEVELGTGSSFKGQI